jgi:hypothetical protein
LTRLRTLCGPYSPLWTVVAIGILTAIAVVLCGDTADRVTLDTRWALIWGRELVEGDLSGYGGGVTPHPLTIALGALFAPLGTHGAATAVSWVLAYFSLGLLAFMTFRLTCAFSTALAGLVAAVLVLVNHRILVIGAASYLDVLFAALVITAVAFEAERPRRGTAPLAALAVAGLLRPEAWALGGLYWLYVVRQVDRRRGLFLLALAGTAPVIWVAMDTLIEGEPMYSLTATESLSDVLYGQYTVLENLRQGFRDLRVYFPLWMIPGALVGIVLMVRRHGWAAAAPLVVLGVMCGVFVLYALTGLPTNPRYLLIPVVLLAVAFGLAAGEWVAMPQSRALVALGLFLCVLAGVRIAGHAPRVADVKPGGAAFGAALADLRALAEDSSTEVLLRRCPTVAVPTPVARGYVAHIFERSPREFVLPGDPRADLWLVPRTAGATEVVSRARFGVAPNARTPAGFRTRASGRDWSLSGPPDRC